MIKSIFISRKLKDLTLLNDWCKKNSWNLSAKPLIEFHPIDFNDEDDFEIIYFSSTRAVAFYLNRVSPSSLIGKKISCSGVFTCESIKKYGLNVDYFLKNPGDIDKSVLDFQNWIGRNKVLFPCSNISLKSVLNGLAQSQIKILETYKTISSPTRINSHDVYVFSSPSNVNSFFENNQIKKDSIIVSWGNSTKKRLADIGYISNYTLTNSTVEELVSYLDTINR